MDVASLAWRTDLALLASAGSVVEHHPTFVVVRTPSAPQRRWGNFLLLRRRPLTRDLPLVRAAFRHHLPEAHHESFGIDAPASPADLAPFRAAGFSTVSLPGILSNVANKEILTGYEEQDQTWAEIAAVKSVPDFKTVTSYRDRKSTRLNSQSH